MASIWRQLILGRPISDAVIKLHRKHHEPRTQPSLREVMTLLHHQISEYSESNVFIIVDALDESPEDSNIRHIILSELRSLLPKIHLMVTSRPHINVASDYPELIRLEIRATDGDLERYVTERMDQDNRLIKLLKKDADLRLDILDTVVKNAEGRYVTSITIFIFKPDFI
jgi:hypothetical protein